MTNRLLVGLDGSPGSDRALEWAVAYAQRGGGEIVAVHILTYSRELIKDLPPTGLTSWRQRLRNDLQGIWTESLRSSGVAFRCILTEASTVEGGLLGVADDEEVELIVLGAHGRGDFANRMLGAVTYKISHAARRPVVIVPVDWRTVDSPAPS